MKRFKGIFFIVFIVLLNSCTSYYRAIHSTDIQVRLKAVDDIASTSDLDFLKKYCYMEHIPEKARTEALIKIKDDNFYKEVVLDRKANDFLRTSALSEIRDDSILIEIVYDTNEDFLADTLFTKIKSEPTLKRVYHDNMVFKGYRDYLKKIQLEQYRAAIRTKEEYENEERRKLSDNSKIEDPWSRNSQRLSYAGNYNVFNYTDVQTNAVKKIYDQNLLKRIVYNENTCRDGRYEAIERITNESILKDIVKDSSLVPHMRHIAIVGIYDQKFLNSVLFDENQSTTLKSNAVKNISNQTTLKKIIKNSDFDFSIRYEACSNITEQNILLEILRTINNESLINTLIKNIESQQLLYKIAIGEGFSYLSPEVEYNTTIKYAALNNLSSVYDILEIGTKKDFYNCRSCFSKLIQKKLGGSSWEPSIENKEGSFFEVLDLLLDSKVIERYGLITFKIDSNVESKPYTSTSSNVYASIVYTDYRLSLRDKNMNTIFSKGYTVELPNEFHASPSGGKIFIKATVDYRDVVNFLNDAIR